MSQQNHLVDTDSYDTTADDLAEIVEILYCAETPGTRLALDALAKAGLHRNFDGLKAALQKCLGAQTGDTGEDHELHEDARDVLSDLATRTITPEDWNAWELILTHSDGLVAIETAKGVEWVADYQATPKLPGDFLD